MSDLAATTAVEPPWALPDSLPRRPVHEPWVERVKRGPGPMLRSIMLIVMAVLLLVGAGTAVWVRYSMQQAVADGALPAQTRSLEYMARALAFRVEQQQKPLQSLKLLPKINCFIIFKNKTPSLSVLSDNDGVFSCYVCFCVG